MPILPADVMALFVCFAPVFSTRVWRHVPLLVVGAILASGQRTVAAALRVVGFGQLATFQTYHRVLNRARWSSRQASKILFGLLVSTFAPHGPLVVGLDETFGTQTWPQDQRCRDLSGSGALQSQPRASRYEGCAGCARCSWSRSPGLVVSGCCPF